jgi:Undecaprenyl-phosphate galactose phosphotransferase WbaP
MAKAIYVAYPGGAIGPWHNWRPGSKQGVFKLSPLALLISDIIFIVFSLLTASRISAADGGYLAYLEQLQVVLLASYMCLWFAARGHYTDRHSAASDIGEITLCVILAALIHLTGSTGSATLWLTVLLFLITGRIGTKWLLFRLGDTRLPALVIGPKSRCAALRSAMGGDWYRGFQIQQEIVCDTVHYDSVETTLTKLANAGKIGLVILATEAPVDEVFKVQALARDLGLALSISHTPHCRFGMNRFFGTKFTVLREVRGWRSWPDSHPKRLLDLTLSLLGLPFIVPIILVISFLIRKDGGPAFYASPRIGYGGKTFQALKFRTMVMDADRNLKGLLERDSEARHEWETTFKLRNDPRVTRIGRVLRRFSLDELPQIINVIRGEMSLVGPRPLLLAERETYGETFDLYCKCIPGITGPWQVRGRNNLAYHQRIELNSWYANNASVLTDMVILMRTLSVVLKQTGAF